jgi:hypothetical protein
VVSAKVAALAEGGHEKMVLLGEGALPVPGKEQEIAAAVGTKSPTGHLAMVRHARDLAPKADVHPAAEVTYPGKAGAEPIHVKFPLEQRCCNSHSAPTFENMKVLIGNTEQG